MKPIERFAAAVLHYRAVIVVGTLALSLPFAYSAVAYLKTENSLEVWFPEDDPQMVGYREFQKKFGSDEFFVVAFETEDAFAPEVLGLLERLTADLEAIEVEGGHPQVLGLANISNRWGVPLALLPFDPGKILEEEEQHAEGGPVHLIAHLDENGADAHGRVQDCVDEWFAKSIRLLGDPGSPKQRKFHYYGLKKEDTNDQLPIWLNTVMPVMKQLDLRAPTPDDVRATGLNLPAGTEW